MQNLLSRVIINFARTHNSGDPMYYSKESDHIGFKKMGASYSHLLVKYCLRDLQTFGNNTAQRMKLFIKDFFSKCDQICSFLQIWSHLLKKALVEDFIFCAV